MHDEAKKLAYEIHEQTGVVSRTHQLLCEIKHIRFQDVSINQLRNYLKSFNMNRKDKMLSLNDLRKYLFGLKDRAPESYEKCRKNET